MQHECRTTVLETKVFPELQEKYFQNMTCVKISDTEM